VISLYGWLSIQGEDSDEGTEAAAFSRLRDKVDQILSTLKWNDVKLKTQNGTACILASLHTNHRTEETEELLWLFQTIEKELPQSFGSLYLLDDDMAPMEEGELFFYSEGTVREVSDPFQRREGGSC